MNNTEGKVRPVLTDRFGRTIDYVRIAVTSACNLRCTYCLKDETSITPKIQQLDLNDTASLIAILGEMGIRKIRFTGGEPLLHPEITELVRNAKSTPGIETVKLTTNGVLLQKYLQPLIEAGLDGVNLSLDTLDPVKFRAITRRDLFTNVRSVLDKLLDTPSLSLKINTLMLRGINSDEIRDFVELTRNNDIAVRFMELQPFDDHQIWRTGRFMGADMIRKHLFQSYPELEPMTGHATEHYSFRLKGYRGSLAIIPAYSRNFCNSCSRLRITADGKMISCLYHEKRIDLIPELNQGENKEEIRKRIIDAVRHKPKDGLKNGEGNAASSMSQIGG